MKKQKQKNKNKNETKKQQVKNLEVSDDDSYFAVGYSIKVKNAPNYANVAIFCTEANDM